MSDYRLTCQDCGEEWIGAPYRTDGYTEICPECNSDEFEIGSEYRPMLRLESLWIVLFVLNAMLEVCR